MAGYKNGKIMLPIKEFLIVKGQVTYELNTIDMTKVTVFYRKYNQEAFLETYSEMPKGDYRINEVGGNKQLQITNLDILDEYYSIQLARVVDLTSSPYSPSGQIDVITLNQHLNEVIADVTFLFTYLKDVGMVMDSSNGNKIMAELKPYTTWYMDKDGNMAAMPVDSLFEKFNNLVEELRKEVLKLLEQDLEVAERELLEEVKRQLDEYVETDLKQRLDDYTTQLEERLQTMIDQAVADKGLMPEGSDWFEIALGNWLVTDLFNKNYTNYPPQLNSSDNAGVVKKDITDDGKSQVIRYYTTTGKMFFAVRVNEVWSEWQELGGQTDTMQFTQANHGFVFTAVTLDGATRKWVKANKYTSADGIAIKIDNDRFDIVTRGVVNIPTQAKDDKGEPFVYDEYYFLSQEVDGGFSRTKNEIGTFQYLAHISEIDGKQVAYIDIGDSYDLDYEIVDTETADRLGIGTYKTTLRTADTIEDLKLLNLKEGDVVELLGYYTKGDGADHKRKIESEDDGSGIQLENGLYANIVHNGEVNVSWFGIQNNVECRAKLQSIIDVVDYKTIIIDKNIVLQQPQGTGTNNSGIVINKEKVLNFVNNCKMKLNGINSPNSSVITLTSTDETITLINPYLIGDKEENTSPTGEWGMGINIINAHNVKVINPIIKNCFGDGVYISNDDKGSIEFLGITDIKNCRRQGVSIIQGNGIYFEYLKCQDIIGTAPMASIDLEPNYPEELIENVVIDRLESINCYYDLLVVSKTKVGVKVGTIISQDVRYSNLRVTGVGADVDVKDIYSDTILSEKPIFARIDNPQNSKIHIGNAFIKNKKYSDSVSDYDKSIIYYNGANKESIECDMIDIDNLQLINCSYKYFLYMYQVPDTQIVSNNMIASNMLGTLILRGDYQLNMEDKSGKRITLTEKNLLPNYINPIVYITNLKQDVERTYTIYGDISSPSASEVITTSLRIANRNFSKNSYVGLRYLKEQKTLSYLFKLIFESKGVLNQNSMRSDLSGIKINNFDPATINENTYRGVELQIIGSSENFSLIQTSSGKLFYVDSKYNVFREVAVVSVASQLNTPYYIYKMEQEGGTTKQDFYTYLDEKYAYDKQLQEEEETKYETYQQALTTNPNLTYEEFITSYPSVIPNIEEPTIPQSVQEFMKKYL